MVSQPSCPLLMKPACTLSGLGLCIHFLQATKENDPIFYSDNCLVLVYAQFNFLSPFPSHIRFQRKVSFTLTYNVSINSPRRLYITPRLGVSSTTFKLDLLQLSWKTKTLQLGHIILRQPFACWWVLFFLVTSLKQTKPFTHLILVKQLKQNKLKGYSRAGLYL